MFRQFLPLVLLIGAAFTYPNPDPKATKNAERPIVNTPLGQIQGVILASRLGKQISAFRGIRYAKAPTEDLRFQVRTLKMPKVRWRHLAMNRSHISYSQLIITRIHFVQLDSVLKPSLIL
jgi:hypothetical protein